MKTIEEVRKAYSELRLCANCLYARAKSRCHGGFYFCHKNPPTPMREEDVDGSDYYVGAFPQVNEDDFCGSFERKE